MIVEFYIGSDKLDLFGDENIEITSAVSDITDITKNLTDYSKNFTVPASPINNRILKHYYNATIDNTFDARTKVDSSIYLNGVLFRLGKVQLNKVDIKKGKPSSYTLFFFGNLINLSKLVGDDKLVDLDLSAYDHDYTSANIKTGLESSLFSGDLIYSLFLKKQAVYNSDPSNTTNTDVLVNIAYQGGANSNGVNYNFLRPSLKNIRIIEAIESKYGITFPRDFFGREEFQKTFLWLNNTSEEKSGVTKLEVDFDGGSDTYVDFATNVGSFDISEEQKFILFFSVFPAPGFENVPYTIQIYRDGNLDVEKNFITASTLRSTLYSGNTETVNLTYEIKTEQNFSFTTSLDQLRYVRVSGVFILVEEQVTTSSIQTIQSRFILNLEMPDIKIIDYLKGFFKMFKLVVIPNSKNDLYVNTQNDYYAQGEVFDITKYVDQENYSVSRGELLSRIEYKFKEPKNILNINFEKQNNEYYGNEEVSIRVDPNDDNSELIDGKDQTFEIPFEVLKYDRLIDQDDNITTNVMYAPVVDEELKPINPAPHIHYNINQDVSLKPIGLINESGTKIQVSTLNTPFHCEKIENPNFSLLFSQEFNEWDGSLMANTLYSNYHAEYIASIFNIKRRDYKYKAFLPFNILTKLSLDDVLQIKDQFFRIDKFTLNLNSGETKLDLISSFGKLNVFTTERTVIQVNYQQQFDSAFIVNGTNISIALIDTGDGTIWVDSYSDGQIVYFDFSENTDPFQRSMKVIVTNNNNPTQQIEFTLIQELNESLLRRLDFSITNNSQYLTTILNTKP